MPWFFIFISGAVVGSFLNVCIFRLPKGESVVFPASHCVVCQKSLAFFDLIPIVSFLLLRGKCRYCGASISWRYPVVEIITAVLFVLVADKFSSLGSIWGIVFYWFFVADLIVIFFTDLEGQVIPDLANFGGIVVGLVYGLWQSLVIFSWQPLIFSLLGLVMGWGLFYLIAQLAKAYFKQEALGQGDLYLAALLGVWLGWQGGLLAIFLAYLLAAIVIVPYLLRGKLKMEAAVPFGPALVAGGIITLFLGQQILSWYFGIVL